MTWLPMESDSLIICKAAAVWFNSRNDLKEEPLSKIIPQEAYRSENVFLCPCWRDNRNWYLMEKKPYSLQLLLMNWAEISTSDFIVEEMMETWGAMTFDTVHVQEKRAHLDYHHEGILFLCYLEPRISRLPIGPEILIFKLARVLADSRDWKY